jgi:hypothetical protein
MLLSRPRMVRVRARQRLHACVWARARAGAHVWYSVCVCVCVCVCLRVRAYVHKVSRFALEGPTATDFTRAAIPSIGSFRAFDLTEFHGSASLERCSLFPLSRGASCTRHIAQSVLVR